MQVPDLVLPAVCRRESGDRRRCHRGCGKGRAEGLGTGKSTGSLCRAESPQTIIGSAVCSNEPRSPSKEGSGREDIRSHV